MTTPTLSETTIESSMLPVYFTPPLINPAPGGLVAATTWVEEETPRWLAEGVAFRASVTGNYSGDLSSGLWGVPWCDEPGSLSLSSGETAFKDGVRPDDPEPFYAVTAWAFDSCDLTAESRAEVRQRAAQVLRMRWPVLVAREFITRAVADAGAPVAVADLTEAIGELEAVLADANAVGVIHASPALLPALAHDLATRTGAGWRTPAGHLVVVDGGYRPVIGDDLLIATSAPLFGWRTPVEVREAVDYMDNTFVAIAERSSVTGCEAVLGSVQVT